VSYLIEVVVAFLVWRLLVTMRRSYKRVETQKPKSVREYVVIKATTENKQAEVASGTMPA